jgi:hypothetical protein
MKHRVPFTQAFFILILLLSTGLQSCTTETPPATSPSPTPATSLGHRTKTSGCVSTNNLPDPACTPGAVFPKATAADICTPGYSSKVRNVPTSTKDKVYGEYGITSHDPGQYEVDHLVALELGGSNSIANLWPEPAEPRPGFHEKDKVEEYLHAQLCDGKLSLQQVQVQIATNWVEVFNKLP